MSARLILHLKWISEWRKHIDAMAAQWLLSMYIVQVDIDYLHGMDIIRTYCSRTSGVGTLHVVHVTGTEMFNAQHLPYVAFQPRHFLFRPPEFLRVAPPLPSYQ